jgi:uncharacterized protein (TIGR02646 family)
MIKVEKDFLNIPAILKKENRREAFDENIASHGYVDAKNRYKAKSVQKRLNQIYNLKCAYCEQKLLDAPKHIEHYRPKNKYYWLAYSWDNLLLSCGSCNSVKSDNFEIKNSPVNYDDESFEDIHNLGDTYDETEKPFIINLEKEDVLALIRYKRDATIFSDDIRVQFTIEKACKLNREELLQKRLPILTDFINVINEHYELFSKHGDITRFSPSVKNFLQKVSKESEFYSFRYFIVHNIDVFFENENMQKIVKALIVKVKNEV